MVYSKSQIAGVLFFIAAAQFIFGIIFAEALYPGYSISNNYISDLGIGPSANIFNVSVFLLGFFMIIGTYFLQRSFNIKILTLLFSLTAIGAMGVGIFNENLSPMHEIFSSIAFLFGGLSAIFSYKLIKKPFSIISIILGVLCLWSMILFITKEYIGLGQGGMERLIVYPVLLWAIGFGGYLLSI